MGWKHSVKTKQFIILSLFILVNVIFSLMIYMGASSSAKNAIYDKMNTQAKFYLEGIDNQIKNIRQLQTEFFTDRKLAFLVYPDVNLSDYERREALLTEEERIQSIRNSSIFIESAELYLPYSNYKITLNGVRNLSLEDEEKIKEYAGYTKKNINYKDNKLFMVSTDRDYSVAGQEMPAMLFYIELDVDKIKESLMSFNTIEKSGTFLKENEGEELIESARGEELGESIVEQLDLKNIKELSRIKLIKILKENYLISVSKSEYLGDFIQYYPEKAVLSELEIYKTYLVLYILVTLAVAGAFSVYTDDTVHKPLKKLLTAFEEVNEQNLDKKITHERENEFSYLYDGFNKMTDKIQTLIQEVYINKNLKQRAELKQLQAQINPHFLYNSFFILNRRVSRGDMESAAEFSNYLGVYFKFLTKNESDDVPLGNEVEHARSYTNIQAVRFSNRIHVEFDECPVEFESFLVPRLILQPLIENVFEHGLEDKEENGFLHVFFGSDDAFLTIHVEDNGDSDNEKTVPLMQSLLEHEGEGEITGIKNIHKRLQIYFGETSGLLVGKSVLGGIHLQIRLPLNPNVKDGLYE